MFLNFGDLKKEPLKVFDYHFKEQLGKLGWLLYIVDNVDLLHEVEINMETYYSDATVFLSGKLETTYTQECGRCLKPYQKNSVSVFKDELKMVIVEGERVLRGEAEENYVIVGDKVDLTDYFRQLFVISQDMKPLCDHDCMGLCSKCGTNLNVNDCNCATEFFDVRFAELQKLKEQLKEK